MNRALFLIAAAWVAGACSDTQANDSQLSQGSAGLDAKGTSAGAADGLSLPDAGPSTLDVSEAVDLGSLDSGGIEAAEPIPFVACVENADCDSGWCVETADGRTCTRTCIDECPNGWFCGSVQNTGTDIVYACLPNYVTLCKPCMDDGDCAANTDAGVTKCIDYGPDGRFCGADCSAEACPAGYTCGEDGQCKKTDGQCGCSWKAVKDAATTVCSLSNEAGTCAGSRGCLDGTLSACDARTPSVEVCDGADNDCDGVVDDGIAVETCTASSDFGTCVGERVCVDGAEVCTAKVPSLEVCNGIDDNCSGTVDEDFPDSNQDGVADCISDDDDGDGVPDMVDNCPIVANSPQADLDGDGLGDSCDGDVDGDGDPNASDCAPTNPAVGADATELCNGEDDDCDGAIDEGFADLDGDGVADCVDSDDDGDNVPDLDDNCPVTANAGQGDTDGDGIGDACEDDLDGDSDPDLTDCDPTDPAIHHGQVEQCNGQDDNCNGFIDEGHPDTDGDGVADCLDPDDDGDGTLDELDTCPLAKNPAQTDTDGDGKGDACDGDDDGDGDPDTLDCAPVDATIHHQAEESCNSKDDDCDGAIDEAGAAGCTAFLWDGDGDGFGLGGVESCLCKGAAPYLATVPGDCDDQNAQVFPNATEVCNGKDDNCNGALDEPGASGCQTFYVDGDQDGFGQGSACVCGLSVGYSSVPGDCDDGAPAVNPSAAEVCGDAIDNNCDGAQDEEGAKGCQNRFLDKDGDQFGQSGQAKCLCDGQGEFTAPVGGDCNDNEAKVFPTNAEVCDGLDNNCNGSIDEGVTQPFFKDNDNDGYGGTTFKEACVEPSGFAAESGDCNDYNGGIHPGASESCNELDDNCNGQIDEGLETTTIYKDNDGDGFAASNAAHFDKCDVPVGWAAPQDADGDGVLDWDCDDSNVTAYPTAAELCDGKDNNCDGYVDTQCAAPCPGAWPVPLPIGSHMPTRIMDLNGDSLEALYTIINTGKLQRIAANGTVTALCPNLTLATGYGNKFVFTVNPALGDWAPKLQQGTRIYDIKTCQELVASPGDKTGFGSVGDFDGDHVLDYAGHNEISPTICVKLSSLGFQTVCLDSPAGEKYDGYLTSYDVDGDGRSELVTLRGRSYPPELYDGHLDVIGYEGGALILESSLPPALTGSVGAHIVGVDIADFFGDGYQTLAVAVGQTILDLATGAELGSLGVTAGIPAPRSFDLDGDGQLDGLQGGITVDLDSDGVPESVTSSGTQLKLMRNPSLEALDGWPLTVGTTTWSVDPVAGDIDNDTRLEIFTPSVDGALYCHRLGNGSARPRYLFEPGEANWVNRTMAKDPFEPNATVESAWPLQFPTKELRAYLTRGDVDYYALPPGGGLFIQLWSPPGLDYNVQWTNEDGSIVYGTSNAGADQVDVSVKCVGCLDPIPQHYVVRISPKDPDVDFSASRPYVLKISHLP